MKRLPECVKRRIVEHLACYLTHAEVVELICEEFEVVLTARHVRAYDPGTSQFAGGAKWRDYHAQARQRFVTEIADIPIAHRAYRLRRLNQIHDQALECGALAIAMNALKQAAKEVGNVYTNVSRQTGRVDHAHLIVEVSADERRNMLADRLRKAFDRMPTAKKLAIEH